MIVPALGLLVGCTPRGGGGGGGAGGGGDDESAVVWIEDLAAEVTRTYRCEPNADGIETACADYFVSFSFRNEGPDAVSALRRVDLTLGDVEATSGPTTCADLPWVLGVDEASDELSISFLYDGIDGLPTLFHPCGGAQTTRTGGGFGEASTSGAVVLRLEGDTPSGGTWGATAETDLLP